MGLIDGHRNRLLGDLVSYANDPVRLGRRIEILSHLAEYEKNILIKFQTFNTDNLSDLVDEELLIKIHADLVNVAHINA